MSQNVNNLNINIEYVHLSPEKPFCIGFDICELQYVIQPAKFLAIPQQVHMPPLVGNLFFKEVI